MDVAHLRRLRCASPEFANCPAGLEVVQGFELLPGAQRGDTVWLSVRLHVLGVVASSEASFMFLADRTETHTDSGSVTMVRHGDRWLMSEMRVASGRLQTSVAAARQFLRFAADERRLLDSVAQATPTPRRPPPKQ